MLRPATEIPRCRRKASNASYGNDCSTPSSKLHGKRFVLMTTGDGSRHLLTCGAVRLSTPSIVQKSPYMFYSAPSLKEYTGAKLGAHHTTTTSSARGLWGLVSTSGPMQNVTSSSCTTVSSNETPKVNFVRTYQTMARGACAAINLQQHLQVSERGPTQDTSA